MKKSIKFLLLIVLCLTLSSCGDKSHRKLFDQLYKTNYEYAQEFTNAAASKGKYTFFEYELSDIKEDPEYESVLYDKAIYKNEGIDRVILSNYEVNGESIYVVHVIEFETVEAAEAMIAKDDLDTIDYVRYENLVYYLDPFGFVFIYGGVKKIRQFYCSSDGLVLQSYDEMSQLDLVHIPNSVKYILHFALQVHTSIKKITCGENLEKIGASSCRKMENLEYFEANSKLKTIGNRALSENTKLKTVILNEGLEYIGDWAFDECPSLEYVVIPKSVIDIGYLAFTSGILYIEAESKPGKWDKFFYGGTAKVYWAGEWEYNEEGIPVPIE